MLVCHCSLPFELQTVTWLRNMEIERFYEPTVTIVRWWNSSEQYVHQINSTDACFYYFYVTVESFGTMLLAMSVVSFTVYQFVQKVRIKIIRLKIEKDLNEGKYLNRGKNVFN
jgi:hypothetical protein